MVYAIARRGGINMSGFFPYMRWSVVVLLPLFVVITWLFLIWSQQGQLVQLA